MVSCILNAAVSDKRFAGGGSLQYYVNFAVGDIVRSETVVKGKLLRYFVVYHGAEPELGITAETAGMLHMCNTMTGESVLFDTAESCWRKSFFSLSEIQTDGDYEEITDMDWGNGYISIEGARKETERRGWWL